MAIATKTPRILHSGKEITVTSRFRPMETPNLNSDHWWNTSGHDLFNMLHEANYSHEVQRRFLNYFQETICPNLGPAPDEISEKSVLTYDGKPFEYSFELNKSSRSPTVRFVVDFSQLRPANKANPLSIAATKNVVASFAKITPGFDDRWFRSLTNWFVRPELSANAQQALVAKVGHLTPVILGFDIRPRMASSLELPVLAKAYFSSCFAAAAEGINRWQAICQAIRQLPEIQTYPNILNSLGFIDEYLSGKPRELQDGARYVATDLVAPGKARLKIYIRIPSTSFDDIWEYYTLGGRIQGLNDDREKFRDLMNIMSGKNDIGAGKPNDANQPLFEAGAQNCAFTYYSLSAENACPAPKIYFCPPGLKANDEVVARGLDLWLKKYGFSVDRTTEERLKNVLMLRELKERTGIVTFIGIGRKNLATKDLSVQLYFTNGQACTTAPTTPAITQE